MINSKVNKIENIPWPQVFSALKVPAYITKLLFFQCLFIFQFHFFLPWSQVFQIFKRKHFVSSKFTFIGPQTMSRSKNTIFYHDHFKWKVWLRLVDSLAPNNLFFFNLTSNSDLIWPNRKHFLDRNQDLRSKKAFFLMMITSNEKFDLDLLIVWLQKPHAGEQLIFLQYHI